MLSVNHQEAGHRLSSNLLSLVNLFHRISHKTVPEITFWTMSGYTVCGLSRFFLFLPFAQFPNFYSFLRGQFEEGKR